MEININDNNKLVEIWLTRAEQQDEALLARIKPLYQRYKGQNYLVAVFRSGEEELYDLTQTLLYYNRRRAAQLRVAGKSENERQSGAAELFK